MPVKKPQALTISGDPSTLKYRIRSLKEEDIPKLMELRRDLKIHDVGSFVHSSWILDSEGIKIVETEKGEIIGSCSAVKIHSDLCFVGLYCLREEYRGLRIGLEIWNTSLQNVGHRNVALNAVPEKMTMYRDKGGFPIVETRFTCNKNFTTEPVNPKMLSSKLPRGVTIQPFQEKHLPAIFEYDFRLMAYKRELALALSSTEECSTTFVALNNGVCVGFGSIKETCLGAGRVSPLYADQPIVAEALLRKLIVSLPNVNSFAMMTVSNNIPAKKFLKKLGCPQMEELTRLYTRDRMDVDTSKIFGLMDLNFAPF